MFRKEPKAILQTASGSSLRRACGACILLISACLVGACGNETSRIGTIPSPDGSVIADWYQISGGGGAGWSQDFVRLRKRGERFAVSSDNVFEAISADNVKVVWNGNRQLQISYPSLTAVDKTLPKWNSVSITFREDPGLQR
jgi:hypothetical protein